MRIAYTINSGVDFNSQNAVLIWHKAIINRLRHIGYEVTLFALAHHCVIYTNNWDLNIKGKLGISNCKLFLLFESIVRKTQSIFNIPYFGLFDSFRFTKHAVLT